MIAGTSPASSRASEFSRQIAKRTAACGQRAAGMCMQGHSPCARLLIAAAMAPLALSIALDAFVVSVVIAGNLVVGALMGAFLAMMFVAMWFVWPSTRVAGIDECCRRRPARRRFALFDRLRFHAAAGHNATPTRQARSPLDGAANYPYRGRAMGRASVRQYVLDPQRAVAERESRPDSRFQPRAGGERCVHLRLKWNRPCPRTTLESTREAAP